MHSRANYLQELGDHSETAAGTDEEQLCGQQIPYPKTTVLNR